MTAHDDAVKAAASALSVHLGDPGDWYDIAAVAVAAAAPILLAPVQAEVEMWQAAAQERWTDLLAARAEVERWESGRRVKVLPVLTEQPDALNLAAELVRKQTGEYEDADAAMRAGATALKNVDKIARAARAALRNAQIELDEARAEVERLTALVNAKQSWIDGAKVDLASSDEAVAVARRCIAAAIRGRCVDHQHEWDDGGAREDVCRRCDAAARIAEGDA